MELNIGLAAACMPAARLYVAKTVSEIAQSAGWTRFTDSSRPTNESSNPSSLIKRRFAAKLKLSLPSGLGGTHFVNTVNREFPDSECEHVDDGDSHVELVDVESQKHGGGEKM